jgi:D-3-phosphoglycerate dehydrogenase
VLLAAGMRVVRGDPTHDVAVLREPLQVAAGWIAGAAPVTEEHFAVAPRLRLVARYGVGCDAVDLQAARRHGVLVTNTPGANAQAVAEMTVGLMLAALRQTIDADRAARAGDWSARVGRELGTSVVGIVGYGRIGQAVHQLLQGFGSPVLVHDPYLPDAAVTRVELEELAGQADVITLHAPPTSQPLVDGRLLDLMRDGTVLINTARAALIDEHAVARALQSGRLGALATDVLTDDKASPLLDPPNVIITPHIAGQTIQAVDRMGMAAAEECVRVLAQALPPRHPVPAAEIG